MTQSDDIFQLWAQSSKRFEQTRTTVANTWNDQNSQTASKRFLEPLDEERGKLSEALQLQLELLEKSDRAAKISRELQTETGESLSRITHILKEAETECDHADHYAAASSISQEKISAILQEARELLKEANQIFGDNHVAG